MSLNDLKGMVSVEKVDGRFQEIISTQKIVDTRTDREYDGFVETDFLKLINDIDDRLDKKRREVWELREVNDLLFSIIDGYRAEQKLIRMGVFDGVDE